LGTKDFGADLLQKLLSRADMSIEQAAVELEIDAQELRAYAEGIRRAPRYVGLALMRLLDLREASR
jgi:hypothetical protein